MADPYYPHTVLRAVFLAAVIFLAMMGLSLVLALTIWPHEIDRSSLVAPSIYAVIFAGGQLALHRFRVGRLEAWGRIPPRGEARRMRGG
ncbi:hypothetical protein CWC38_03175 [Kocuria tytonicola]|nr:hypothetical protein CWC38_03175 [Kocuria tytonicola]